MQNIQNTLWRNTKMIDEFNLCKCGNEKPIEEKLCLHCWTLENNFYCECEDY